MTDLSYEYKGRWITEEMSDVTNIIYAISNTRRVLDEQIAAINGYLSTNTQKIQEVRRTLTGSTTQADRRMLTLLQEAESSLKESVRSLQEAKDDLERVQSYL